MAKVALLISNNADFKESKVNQGKKRHYVMVKASILQKDTTTLKVYTTNNRMSKYMRQQLIEVPGVAVDESATIAGEFNTLHQKRTDPAGRKPVRTQLNSKGRE